jgi:hypothetical protein
LWFFVAVPLILLFAGRRVCPRCGLIVIHICSCWRKD